MYHLHSIIFPYINPTFERCQTPSAITQSHSFPTVTMYRRLFFLALVLAALTLCRAAPDVTKDATVFQAYVPSVEEPVLNQVVRDDDDDDDDDDGGKKGKVVVVRRGFACSATTGRVKFNKCRRCVRVCLNRLGKKIQVVVGGGKKGGDDDDDDDDDCEDDDDDDDDDGGCRKKTTKTVTRVTCGGNKKCLACTNGCRRRLGVPRKFTKVIGGGKGGDDDDDDDRR